MNSLKNIIWATSVICVIVVQLFYVFVTRQDINRRILDTDQQIMTTERELNALEEKVKLLPLTKQELEKMNEQKVAVLNTIPPSISATKAFIEIHNIMATNGFLKVKVEEQEKVNHEDENGTIIEKKYTLTYVSPFSESKKFVENLNNSYQLLNIHDFSIDNSIQTDKDRTLIALWYGDKMKEVVTSKVTFSMFVKPNDSLSDEIYQPVFNGLSDTQNAFFNRDEIEEAAEPGASNNTATLPVPTQSTETENIEDSDGQFRLDISDALTSGDTYKFLGPGSDANSYSGLLSSVDTYVTLTVKDEGYTIVLEDENGKVKQNGVLMPIKNPRFTIYSQMRQLEEAMPKVHIYIQNYTSKTIDVTLNGTLLENIHVYNEFDEEVVKGQTKGKVKLT